MTNQDCIAHYTPLGTPYKCIFAQYVLPFIKTPLFIAQVRQASSSSSPRASLIVPHPSPAPAGRP